MVRINSHGFADGGWFAGQEQACCFRRRRSLSVKHQVTNHMPFAQVPGLL